MNLFDLSAVITLDTRDYERGIDRASRDTGSLAGKIGNGLKTAAKIGTAAITTAATGIAALTGNAVKNYAEYEQLVGGVETLFKDSADIVQKYAENAYKTAGMSANEYMDTVTSFSASLLQSLGGDTGKAAEQANKAITDMSDNANKMGTAIESIQYAYQGFAKQNFTMLDNLKLGYGGTKEEMQRLLSDAEKLSGIKYDLSSYSDIVDAIHVVQTEMGVAGTTAKEAATTISGSLASMKSAWTNLTVGIADDNADIDTLINNFVDSTSTAFSNLMPRIEIAISGLGKLVQKLAPVIGESIPVLITTVLPSLIKAGASLIQGLVSGIIQSAPVLLSTGGNLMLSLSGGIANGLPTLLGQVPTIISNFIDYLSANFPAILEQGVQIVLNLAHGILEGIPKLLSNLPQLIHSIVDFFIKNLPVIIEQGVKFSVSLSVGMIKAIPKIIAEIPKIITAIVDGLSNAISAVHEVGVNIVKGLWNGVLSMAGWISDKVTGFINGIVDGVKGVLGIHSPSRVFAGIGEYMAQGLGKGWDSEYSKIKSGITSGLDFGTASVDFSASAIGVSSAGIMNGMYSQNSAASASPMVLNLVLPDGSKLASYMLNPLSEYAKSNGTPILNPI